MKKRSGGFTLIEVALFLAVTGLLFIGIIGGVQNSLDQQRDNDAVYNFMEFLRGVYSQVANVQNTADGGRSDKVVYGKLVTFGEEWNLAGNENTDGSVFVYTVIGNETDTGTKGSLVVLSEAGANVREDSDDGIGALAGIVESYEPKWGVEIQPGCTDTDVMSGCFKPLKGSLLIVRHPMSGNIETFFSDRVVPVNADGEVNTEANPFGAEYGLTQISNWEFKNKQIDFCLNVGEKDTMDRRFDIRILKGAHNASGIELVPDNGAEGMDETDANWETEKNQCRE